MVLGKAGEGLLIGELNVGRGLVSPGTGPRAFKSRKLVISLRIVTVLMMDGGEWAGPFAASGVHHKPVSCTRPVLCTRGSCALSLFMHQVSLVHLVFVMHQVSLAH